MHYDVIPGKEEEFEKGFTSVLEHLKKVAGHVESHLYEDVNSLGSYLIQSQFYTKVSLESFIHCSEFRKVVIFCKEEILRSRPRHKVYLNA